jgi:hypothetical protein
MDVSGKGTVLTSMDLKRERGRALRRSGPPTSEVKVSGKSRRLASGFASFMTHGKLPCV